MERVGEDLRGRVGKHLIETAALRLAHNGVFSDDILTERVRVNTGNLAFSLSKKARRLRVIFLDIDATENFVDTSHVPIDAMFTLWYKIICECLGVASEPITYMEYETARSQWRNFFDMTA
jgi:hypothetical protein